MENKVLNLTYASSLTNLREANSSFDSGILKIAYPGDNRNGSSISKQAFERSLKTIYNCPVVCNYNRETDTLGGHDMEVIRQTDGGLKLVNLTTPVGCIPESAKVFWQEVTEEDGTTKEYLCAEALIWKRQEAYQKIKSDGIVEQSMEINVKEGKTIDGVYHIEDFEFTAFALIGVEPCFESASLEMFSKQNFKQLLSEMMHELKESFNLITPSNEVDDTHNTPTEGGAIILDKNEIIAKYGIDVSTLDFSIDEYTAEELEEKFKSICEFENPKPTEETKDTFALTSTIIDEVISSLGEIKVQRDWGEGRRYLYVDCDLESKEVYCWDTNDWLLYGFSYEMNGDNVVIDFDSKKRKKYTIVDFDEGEQQSPFFSVFEQMESIIKNNADWEVKYQTANNTIETMTAELDELRKFKTDTEASLEKNKRDAIFAQFEDLIGNESFEALKVICNEYDPETLEEKCYAIRGRLGANAKFAIEPKSAPKQKVDHRNDIEDEPYGGLFTKYGITKNN